MQVVDQADTRGRMPVQVSGGGFQQERPVLGLGGTDTEIGLFAAVHGKMSFTRQQSVDAVPVDGEERGQGDVRRIGIRLRQDRKPELTRNGILQICRTARTALDDEADH